MPDSVDRDYRHATVWSLERADVRSPDLYARRWPARRFQPLCDVGVAVFAVTPGQLAGPHEDAVYWQDEGSGRTASGDLYVACSCPPNLMMTNAGTP